MSNRRLWNWLSVAVVSFAGGSRLLAEPAMPTTRPATLTPTEAVNAFACDLYGRLAEKEAGKNVFFSPFSIAVGLAMAAEGAGGETAEEMGRVLRVPESARTNDHDRPWDLAGMHASLGGMTQRIAGEDSVELKIANALWVERTFSIQRAWVDTVAKHYKTARLIPLNFRGDPEGSRALVNGWVAEMTKGRILDILGGGQVDQSTRLLLTNAIYFKGRWADPFEARRTAPDAFTLADGTKIRVPMMFKSEHEKAKYAAFKWGWLTVPRERKARGWSLSRGRWIPRRRIAVRRRRVVDGGDCPHVGGRA